MGNADGYTGGRVLDRAEQKWLQDKWHQLDSSGDGSLDANEVAAFLDSVSSSSKSEMSAEDKTLAFSDMDTDGEGSIEVWSSHWHADIKRAALSYAQLC
jgi:Ca2+-binding EF-hand superfamily protein